MDSYNLQDINNLRIYNTLLFVYTETYGTTKRFKTHACKCMNVTPHIDECIEKGFLTKKIRKSPRNQKMAKLYSSYYGGYRYSNLYLTFKGLFEYIKLRKQFHYCEYF